MCESECPLQSYAFLLRIKSAFPSGARLVVPDDPRPLRTAEHGTFARSSDQLRMTQPAGRLDSPPQAESANDCRARLQENTPGDTR